MTFRKEIFLTGEVKVYLGGGCPFGLLVTSCGATGSSAFVVDYVYITSALRGTKMFPVRTDSAD